MNERTRDQVETWDTRPVSGGYRGLAELAARGFSGVISARGTWLFMLNGRGVGIYGGSLDVFEGREATAHLAPDPSLPLLFAMQEEGGDVEAKYYTNDTPLSEADRTLTSGNFTGFVELSENVLSGDYYVVYYGGRSMSCAFVGESERLLTGDEAFERANDEVGIYEVRKVDVEVIDIPTPEEPDEAADDQQPAGGRQADQPPAGDGPVADQPGDGDQQTDRQPTGQPDAHAAGGNQQADAPAGGQQSDAPAGGQQSDAPAGGGQPDAPAPGGQQPDPQDAAGQQSPDRAAAGADQQADPEVTGQQPSAGQQPPAGEQPPTDQQPSAGQQPPADGQPAADQPPPGEGGDAADGSADATADATGTDATTPDATGAGEADPANVGAAGSAAGPGDGTAGGTAGDASAAGDAATTGDASAPGDGGATSEGAAVADLDEAAAVGEDPEEGVFSDEAEWQEARTIPSLNPQRSGDGRAAAGVDPPSGTGGAAGGVEVDLADADDEPAADAAGVGTDAGASPADGGATGPSDAAQATDSPASPGGAGGSAGGTADQEVAELQSRLQQRETEMGKLRQQLTAVQDDRDDLQRERDALAEKVDQLEDEVERLESQLREARAAAGDEDAAAGTPLSPAEALAGTNFFVRYATKGGGTLEKAHGGDVDREEVNNNLRLEHHTRFEQDEVVVDGEPFDSFLAGTMESAFVTWVVEKLLYEIRDTSYEGRLRDVYDAIPRIDRAELQGSITVEYREDGEQYRDEVTFDVVLRDRMGNPLVVANLNDGRDPTTVEMMESLVEDATKVKESHDTLGAAMFVTASFFQPGALETADEAAASGLLSRDKRASFVTDASTGGYHLCLVENRGGDFHVNVPDM